MKRTKRFLSLILSVLLLLTFTMPVMAATEDYTITINKNASGYSYAAYQIFAGDLEVKTDGTKVLTQITWGTGIDPVEFLEALKGELDPNTITNDDIKKAFITEWNQTYAPLYSETNTADEVALILSSDARTSHAQAFAQLAGYYLIDTEESKVSFTETTTDSKISYVSELVDSGYYLIRNTGTTPQNTTATDFMLKLVETITVTPKDGEVTVDKYIVDGQDKVKEADYSIGDIVTFELHGTLPDYFDSYNKYYYEFQDKMSPGLSLVKIDDDSNPETPEIPDVTVVFDNDGSLRTVDKNLYTVETGTIAEDASENPGYSTINIKFNDLQALERNHPDDTNTPEIEGYTVSADTKITVIYKAKLNENAVVGGNGNPNKVTIEFTNDPNTYGTGETEEKDVNVYTFALEVIKKDGSTNEFLDGVEFKLYRMHGGAKQFAVAEEKEKVGDKIVTYVIKEWSSVESEGTAFKTVSKDDTAKGQFKIIGLEASEYWLKETKTLPGYNDIEDIHFFITKELENNGSRAVKTVSIRLEGKEAQPGDALTGTVSTTVINKPGNQLPSTGGIGTKIFYSAGGVLVAAAVVRLVTKKRMSEE